MNKKKRILVAPLDWGLGHATRCIPIIRTLISENVEVIIGTDGKALELLRQEFPNLPYIPIPGYSITYPRKGNMALSMARQFPKVIRRIRGERKGLNKFLKKERLDGLISDNRYGLYTNKVPSVFITHQLKIRTPFFQKPINWIAHSYIKKHKKCWVPDTKDPKSSLSGSLSHIPSPPVEPNFLGPLSRYTNKRMDERKEGPVRNILAIVSGPEPQRGIFLDILKDQLPELDKELTLVSGDPEGGTDHPTDRTGKITEYAHLSSKKMTEEFEQADLVISRPGYSTIMDLAVMGKPGLLVPTPGQTEQEYLARYHYDMGHHLYSEQKDLDIPTLLDEEELPKGIYVPPQPDTLNSAIREFLDILQGDRTDEQ